MTFPKNYWGTFRCRSCLVTWHVFKGRLYWNLVFLNFLFCWDASFHNEFSPKFFTAFGLYIYFFSNQLWSFSDIFLKIWNLRRLILWIVTSFFTIWRHNWHVISEEGKRSEQDWVGETKVERRKPTHSTPCKQTKITKNGKGRENFETSGKDERLPMGPTRV